MALRAVVAAAVALLAATATLSPACSSSGSRLRDATDDAQGGAGGANDTGAGSDRLGAADGVADAPADLAADGAGDTPGPSCARITGVRIDGTAERVWIARDNGVASDPDNIPDAPAAAFRAPDGAVSLLITHFKAYRITGASLDAVNPASTELVFRSNLDVVESHYDYRHWIFAPYTFDGGKTFYALAHHEWYGCLPMGDCGGSKELNSWTNSITLLRSFDAGKSWAPAQPAHVVLHPAPWGNKPYDTLNNYGYFHPSRFVTEGDYHYSFMRYEYDHSGIPPAQRVAGMAMLRTRDFASFQIWRGGSTWQDVPAGGAVTDEPLPLIPGSQNVIMMSPTRSSIGCTFLVVYPDSADGGPAPLMFTVTDGLASPSWSPPRQIDGSDAWQVPSNVRKGFSPNNYPSVLDPTSPGQIFDTSAAAPYLYYQSIGSQTGQFDRYRDLYRVRLHVDTVASGAGG